MDDDLDLFIQISISIMVAITTTLQTVLRFDKVGEGYICANRIIEQVILEYEERRDTDLDVLYRLI